MKFKGLVSSILVLFLILTFYSSPAEAKNDAVWYTIGSGPLKNEVGFPTKISTDSKGNLYVLDGLKSCITIFDKNFSEYKDKTQVGKIVVADGRQSINIEYGRKSIYAEKMLFASVSQVRQQAKDMNLFGEDKRPFLHALEEEKPEEKNTTPHPNPQNLTPNPSPARRGELDDSDFSKELDEKIEENKAQKPESIDNEITRYVVDIPKTAVKEDLLKFKEFLSSQDDGIIAVFIRIQGQEVDTKMTLESLEGLKEWEENNL